jgi:glycolate oxidase FAD binding subunit
MDDVIRGWQERIRSAHAARTPLRFRGGGTKDFFGGPLTGDVLDTRQHAGVVAYEPTELVITARCGTTLDEIERAMGERGQMLAFEPPRFGPGATIGGCVAAGLSGPRRPYAGAVRDLVLGVRVIDGTGVALRFGGQVMKNVAGFDVARLLAGSLGTLALVTEVSLKCLPVPRTEATRAFELALPDAIRRINEWSARPLPITASAWDSGRLVVRFAGAAAAVDAAIATLGGEAVTDAGYWPALREQAHPYFAGPVPLWRLSVKSTAPATPVEGAQLMEWGGAQRWLRASTDAAESLRKWSAEHGGHATLFRSDGPRDAVFQPLPPSVDALHRRLKAALDPAGIFNPGRLYPGF